MNLHIFMINPTFQMSGISASSSSTAVVASTVDANKLWSEVTDENVATQALVSETVEKPVDETNDGFNPVQYNKKRLVQHYVESTKSAPTSPPSTTESAPKFSTAEMVSRLMEQKNIKVSAAAFKARKDSILKICDTLANPNELRGSLYDEIIHYLQTSYAKLQKGVTYINNFEQNVVEYMKEMPSTKTKFSSAFDDDEDDESASDSSEDEKRQRAIEFLQAKFLLDLETSIEGIEIKIVMENIKFVHYPDRVKNLYEIVHAFFTEMLKMISVMKNFFGSRKLTSLTSFESLLTTAQKFANDQLNATASKQENAKWIDTWKHERAEYALQFKLSLVEPPYTGIYYDTRKDQVIWKTIFRDEDGVEITRYEIIPLVIFAQDEDVSRKKYLVCRKGAKCYHDNCSFCHPERDDALYVSSKIWKSPNISGWAMFIAALTKDCE